jgi:UDP-hydrolysing UDP-N-acetyl-D-glucosamine 2-epimerase
MTESRTIAVVTGSRADYGLLRPVLRAIEDAPGLVLRLLVCGAHLSPRFGMTVGNIEADGFTIAERLDILAGTDTPNEIAQSTANAVSAFARAFERSRPDLLVLLGDRYEMLSAAIAALPFAIPIAHIHGGELTEGAIDEAARHSLTKLSHVHFVTTEAYRRRVIQLGEQPDRVFVSGAPGLDNLRAIAPTPVAELSRKFGIAFDPAPLLVTFHSETLEVPRMAEHLAALMEALASAARPVVFTYPCADTAARQIVEAIEAFVAARSDAIVVKNLDTADYFGMMAAAAAMVGNSSSGIIEAPSFHLPVVNIGNRQRGRLRAANVIDCAPEQAAIGAAIARAVDPGFRKTIGAAANPYGDGRAAERIVAVLRGLTLDAALVAKRFYDIDFTPPPARPMGATP